MKTLMRVVSILMAWALLIMNIGQDIACVKAAEGAAGKSLYFAKEADVTVDINVVSEWEGGYQAEITLANVGSEVINGWQLDFNTSDVITNIWNCDILRNDEELCSVSSTDYNSVIEPNGTISIGYYAEGSNQDITNLKISLTKENSTEETVNGKDAPYVYVYETFTVEYGIQNNWDENCNVLVKILNTSDENIENWEIAWKSKDTISNVYNAKMSCEDGLYTLKNLGYNQDILAGEAVEFGFDVYYGDAFDIPKGFVMPGLEMQTVDADLYTFENLVTDKWEGGYIGEIHLTNLSNHVMEEWCLTMQGADTITSTWNGELTDLGNGMYEVKNPQHSQNIQPGETIIIGYQASGSNYESLVPVVLSTQKSDMVADQETEESEENTESGEIEESEESTESGEIEESEESTESEETEESEESTESEETEESEESTESGEPEESEETTESGDTEESEESTETEEEQEPLKENYIEVLTTFEQIQGEATSIVSEAIATYNGILNNLSHVASVRYEVMDAFENLVLSGDLSYDRNDGTWTLDDFGLTIGWNDVTFIITRKDGTEVRELFSYVNSSYENMEKTQVDLRDNDGDGINNYYESIYGTDKDKADTDDDTLSDYAELMATGTDPAMYDTDGNGISDAQEDTDNDGLTNVEELTHGTSPWYADSDLDGIDDKTEMESTGTNPVKEDTDEDGLTDGEELKLGLSPLLKDTNGDGIPDGEEKIEQQVSFEAEEAESAVSGVSVGLACSGDIEGQVFIENTMGTDELSSEVVGLIGFPVEISSMTPFEEAVITFHYDVEKLGETREEDLCILWYDEENMQYVMLEDCVVDTVNQTVSYTTTHFSTYLLIDKEIWLDAWRAELDYDNGMPEVEDGVTYDIFICLDYSVTEEELAKEKEFARKIIEQMIEGDRVKLSLYKSKYPYGYYYVDWMTEKEYLLSALEDIEETIYNQYEDVVEPTGDYYAECYQAINLFTSMVDKETSNEKIGFIVNAGKNEDTFKAIYKNSKEQAEKDLTELGFPVHSVSVTDKVNDELIELLNEYEGNSFNATTLDDVERRYGFSGNEFDMLDSDGDGLYDTYEVNGLRIQNGKVIYTDPYAADTDGDGLSDFDEVGGLPASLVVSSNQYAVTINYQKSDPNDAQSTGKRLKEGYMVVEDFNYLPYDKETYEMIYVKNTHETDYEGKLIYGRYNIYNSNPNELTEKEIKQLRTKVKIQCCVLEKTSLDRPLLEARTFLEKYIYNQDTRNKYDCAYVLGSSLKARNIWANDMWHLMIAAEDYLDVNQTILLAQTPENNNVGIDFPGTSVNGFLGIHSAKTRIVANVSYDGSKYTMDLKYYILDYYDWDKYQTAQFGLVSDSELYKLCRCGAARFYENWGCYETQLVWEPNEDKRDDVLKMQKRKLALGINNNDSDNP